MKLKLEILIRSTRYPKIVSPPSPRLPLKKKMFPFVIMEKFVNRDVFFNPFVLNAPFLYPSENIRKP